MSDFNSTPEDLDILSAAGRQKLQTEERDVDPVETEDGRKYTMDFDAIARRENLVQSLISRRGLPAEDIIQEAEKFDAYITGEESHAKTALRTSLRTANREVVSWMNTAKSVVDFIQNETSSEIETPELHSPESVKRYLIEVICEGYGIPADDEGEGDEG